MKARAENKAPKPKVRNYSFKESKRLPLNRMTVVNGVRIPSMPGSCYHSIISALAEYKDKFCSWDKIISLSSKNMRMFGGQEVWDKFYNKSGVKSYSQRIKDNTHTLTRAGRDCYGYRLHEMGMAIYFFKDGAMLITGGELKSDNDCYNVVFPDGGGLQKRYRGTTMTFQEYKKFEEVGFIDKSGTILDSDGIRNARNNGLFTARLKNEKVQVCISLAESYNQETANRLHDLGLEVEESFGGELIGSIPSNNVRKLREDKDVKGVESSL